MLKINAIDAALTASNVTPRATVISASFNMGYLVDGADLARATVWTALANSVSTAPTATTSRIISVKHVRAGVCLAMVINALAASLIDTSKSINVSSAQASAKPVLMI